jgi:UDP-N-acetyl-D-mannosaminuronic acid dehydrogenase
MGLPLAAVYAQVTGNVTGIDVDESVVDTINAGDCPVRGEPDLPALVSRLVSAGALEATTAGNTAIERASVHVIIVPTLIDERNDPDLTPLIAALETIGAGLSPGDLVIVESTVPPGTCREVAVPILEDESGLELGEFGVAFCPERTSSGRALEDIRGAYPKVVGGADEESTRTAAVIYEQITDNDVLTVSNCTTAECVKIFEGLYRDVNIALANELATFTDELGIDVNEAIDVANTQPFCDIHRPGPGVGGHCIPYYPYFLISETQTEAPLLKTARSVNDQMPAFVVSSLRQELSAIGRRLADADVLLLGVTYRPGIDETRASPAYPLANQLSKIGANVTVVDPVCSDVGDVAGTRVSLDEVPSRSFDAAVLVTAHDEFDSFPWEAFEDLVVVDGRQALDPSSIRHHVYTIGTGQGRSPLASEK